MISIPNNGTNNLLLAQLLYKNMYHPHKKI